MAGLPPNYFFQTQMWIKLLLLFFVFSFLFRTDQSFDQDLGRHIKLGEIILNTGNIPKINLFSYTNGDFPFINTHWLFEVFAYLMFQSIGLQALLILKIIIFLVSVWLTLKLVPKQSSALLLLIGFIFLQVLRERLELRPEVFSFLFTASTYFILERFLRGPTKLIYSLPFIQLIWINTHIYFFVGLILQVIFLIHLSYQSLRFNLEGWKLKLLSIIFILSVLVSLVNPNGISGVFYPLNVTKNYGYTIVENQTLFLLESINFKNPNFLFVKICWGIIILSFIFAFIKRRFEAKFILLSVFGLGLSLMNVRSFPYLVFLTLPAVLANLSLGVLSRPPSRWAIILNMLVGLILLYESFLYLSGSYYKSRSDSHQVGLRLQESVKVAMDFVLVNDLPTPIFNNFDIGSYIIYRGYPKYRVFVDGRPEAYPQDFFQNTYIPMQSDFQKFKLEEGKWGFKTIIFSHTDQTPWGQSFLQSVVKDPSWRLVYFDDFMLVLLKENVANEKKLKMLDLASLSPADYNFDNRVSYLRMGIFLLKTNNNLAAQKFMQIANSF